MESFPGSELCMEMALPMDVAAVEEVVMQGEVGAEVELQADSDSLAPQDVLRASKREPLSYPGDSSDDDCSSVGSRPPALQRTPAAEVWIGSAKDDCLCWECGERFCSLEQLMKHFRKHEAQVCCNLCRVTFRRVVSLSMHLENVHNDIGLFCTACRLPFDSKWDLNKHLGNHTNLKDPPLMLCQGRSGADWDLGLGPSELAAKQGVYVEKAGLPDPGPADLAIDSNGQGLSQEDSILPALVAKEHAYNETNGGGNTCRGNGTVTTTYALRMRHTKTLTKVFPRESLPESAHQKKIQFFVFRSVDRSLGGKGDGGQDVGKFREDEEDVKPEPSSLIPPLPDSLAHPGYTDPSSSVKQEGADPDGEVLPWEGAPVEEGDELDEPEEEEQSDGGDSMTAGDSDSDYNPGELSDTSSESASSGNSSGSSYCPRKSLGKKAGARGAKGPLLDKKQCKAGTSFEMSQAPSLAPTPGQQTDAGESRQCSRCGAGPYSTSLDLHRHLELCAKQKVAHCAPCNMYFPDEVALRDHKVKTHPSFKPSRMYACDACREVFPEQVVYRRHCCPMKAPINTPASAPASLPSVPSSVSGVGSVAPTVLYTSAPSTGGQISTSSASLCPVGVREVVRMTVPCPVQNSTLMSPVPTGPSFPLPGIMVSGSATSSQSSSLPVMATVVFSGNSTTGRVARVLLQSQGITFPTPTLTQAPAQTQPLRLSSVPVQAKTSTQTAPLSSMQLTNLLLRGVIQPQTLFRASRPQAPVAAPISAPVHRPVSVPKPAPLPVPLSKPVPLSVRLPTPAPVPVPVPVPVPLSSSTTVSVSLPKPVPLSISLPSAPVPVPVSRPLPTRLSVPTASSSLAPEPLKILGLYVNCSQQLALERRLKKSWRSKGVFLCRQCGAASRQPSLGVRHRYLHRGSRQHRCHCGRTFQRLLHLLRHHIQHAEATRFVCAPCGQTFSGAHCLARHKQGRTGEGKRPINRRGRRRKDCQAPFSCDCGQLFQRPNAFLWHKLKNPKVPKRV